MKIHDSIHQDESQEPEKQQAGTILKKAREAQDLSIDDVAVKLKLKRTVIMQLEEGSIDEKHYSSIFVRGYLRSYAKLLGISSDEIANIYDVTHGVNRAKGHENDVKMQSFSHRTKIKATNSRVTLLTWSVILLVAILFVAWWWQNRSTSMLLDVNNATTSSAVLSDTSENTTGDPAITDLTPSTTAKDSQNPTPTADMQDETPQASAITNTTDDPAEDHAAAKSAENTASTENIALNDVKAIQKKIRAEQETPATTPSATQASLHQGRIVLKGDCWLSVRDMNGQILSSGLKKAGSTVNFSGKAPFTLVFGAPANVNLFYQGKEVNLSKYSKNGKVARLTLTD